MGAISDWIQLDVNAVLWRVKPKFYAGRRMIQNEGKRTVQWTKSGFCCKATKTHRLRGVPKCMAQKFVPLLYGQL